MIKLLTGVASFSSGDSPIAPDVSRDGSFNFFSRLAAPGSVPGRALFCRRSSISLQSLRATVCRLRTASQPFRVISFQKSCGEGVTILNSNPA
jgi:hypothetical protein